MDQLRCFVHWRKTSLKRYFILSWLIPIYHISLRTSCGYVGLCRGTIVRRAWSNSHMMEWVKRKSATGRFKCSCNKLLGDYYWSLLIITSVNPPTRVKDNMHLPLRLRSDFLCPFMSWHLCSWRILSRLILDNLSRRTASRCDVTSASIVARSRKILLVVKLKFSLKKYLTYFAENWSN